MKVKNEYIKIKTKNKNITLQNLILDNYLKAIKNIQFTTNATPVDIRLTAISFMLNHEIYISPDAEYDSRDFYLTITRCNTVSILRWRYSSCRLLL